MKPIRLPCPCCRQRVADIEIRLWKLGLGNEFSCEDCGTYFGAAEVEAMIAAWAPVLAWLRQAPAVPAPDAGDTTDTTPPPGRKE